MHLILALGNPGPKYQFSRHNSGFMFVDWLGEKLKTDADWELKKALFSSVLTNLLPPNSNPLYLAKPSTFMNESGKAALKLVKHFKIEVRDLLVVHDDLDIPFGEFRLQFGRGPAGHHGVESVIGHLKSQDFWRLRIGICPDHPVATPEEFVLSEFTKSDREDLKRVFEEGWLAFAKVLA